MVEFQFELVELCVRMVEFEFKLVESREKMVDSAPK